MPNSERSGVLFNTRVKYEKSSVTLHRDRLAHSCIKVIARSSRDLRMGSVRQGEERQQVPVVVNGGITSLV